MSILVESGKSKSKMLAILVSGVACLPGLQTATFLLYLHMPGGEETRSKLSNVSSYKGTNPIMGDPPS